VRTFESDVFLARIRYVVNIKCETWANTIIDKWGNAIVKIIAAPDVKQRLKTLGFAPVANTPAELGERIKVEIARWGKVVRDANIWAD
jgi:tripartite-type tricarboxylate transporter receptor subunit TctC